MSLLTEDQENQLQEAMRVRRELQKVCYQCGDCNTCETQPYCKKWKDYLAIDDWVKFYSDRLRYARECEENYYRDND